MTHPHIPSEVKQLYVIHDYRHASAILKQVNLIATRKREHSRKPDEVYDLIESCSPGPYLELFARHSREGWLQWGNEFDDEPLKTRRTSRNGSHAAQPALFETKSKYK